MYRQTGERVAVALLPIDPVSGQSVVKIPFTRSGSSCQQCHIDRLMLDLIMCYEQW